MIHTKHYSISWIKTSSHLCYKRVPIVYSTNHKLEGGFFSNKVCYYQQVTPPNWIDKPLIWVLFLTLSGLLWCSCFLAGNRVHLRSWEIQLPSCDKGELPEKPELQSPSPKSWKMPQSPLFYSRTFSNWSSCIWSQPHLLVLVLLHHQGHIRFSQWVLGMVLSPVLLFLHVSYWTGRGMVCLVSFLVPHSWLWLSF